MRILGFKRIVEYIFNMSNEQEVYTKKKPVKFLLSITFQATSYWHNKASSNDKQTSY